MSDRTVYMDYAATSPMDNDTIDVVAQTMRDVYGNPSSKHDVGDKASKVLEKARADIAQCINAEPNEIFFTSGGTESDNWVMSYFSFPEVIASKIEHDAVLYSTYCKGLSVNEYGIAEPDSLRKRMESCTHLVSIMLANNEIGTIEPIKELAEIAHGHHGTLFHTDAVQAVGHIPVDVKELGVDMLSAAGHKFGAPKGIGFLYVKNNTDISGFMHGGGQELGMRAGTENVPGAVGMAYALKKSCERMKTSDLSQKRDYMIEMLEQIDGIHLNGARGLQRLPGNINIRIDGVYNESMLHMLNGYGICVSAGSACTSSSIEPSHVLKAIGLSDTDASHSIRISIADATTYDDIQYTVDAIKKICERIRR